VTSDWAADMGVFRAIGWLATYLLHSTIFLLGAWWLASRRRAAGPRIIEATWKAAALAGLFTATLTSAGLLHPPKVQLPGSRLAHRDDAGAIDGAARPADRPRQNDDRPGDRAVRRRENIGETRAATEITSARPTDAPDDETKAMAGNDALPPLLAREEDHLAGAKAESFVVDTQAEKPHVDTAALHRVDRSDDGHDSRLRALISFAPYAVAVALLAGATAAASFVIQSGWLSRRLAHCERGSERAVRLLGLLRQQAEVQRPVDLLCSTQCREPWACGLWRWKIVLPAGLEDRLNDDELRALLTHELAHLVRGDCYWLWLGGLLSRGLFLQPLNSLARRRWQRQAELLCDDWAVAQGTDPLTLARCLTSVADWRLGSTAAPGMAAAGGNISDRVERLVARNREIAGARFDRLRFSALALAIAVSLAAVAPAFEMPRRSDVRHGRPVDDLKRDRCETQRLPSAADGRFARVDCLDFHRQGEIAQLDRELRQLRQEFQSLTDNLDGPLAEQVEPWVARFDHRTRRIEEALDRLNALRDELQKESRVTADE